MKYEVSLPHNHSLLMQIADDPQSIVANCPHQLRTKAKTAANTLLFGKAEDQIPAAIVIVEFCYLVTPPAVLNYAIVLHREILKAVFIGALSNLGMVALSQSKRANKASTLYKAITGEEPMIVLFLPAQRETGVAIEEPISLEMKTCADIDLLNQYLQKMQSIVCKEIDVITNRERKRRKAAESFINLTNDVLKLADQARRVTSCN